MRTQIADFGLSNVFDNRRMLATFCGSPLYASPEIVKGTPYEGPEVDCWSLGVLLYTLVYGAMPFDGSNFKRLVKQISAGDYYEPKKSSPASPLIREMLTVCPLSRATIEQICNHWWVNEGYPDSCLDVAEELANQTPVRLDVLLSLTPQAVTSDQLVVGQPGAGGGGDMDQCGDGAGAMSQAAAAGGVGGSGGGVGGVGGAGKGAARSHSVGSIRDMSGSVAAGPTEAERRILDMVAAGGEAALAPSPTRTITPSESPAQPKRKLEMGISTESVLGIAMKKDKQATAAANAVAVEAHQTIAEAMDEDAPMSMGNVRVQLPDSPTGSDDMGDEQQQQQQQQSHNLNAIEEMCNELLHESSQPIDQRAPSEFNVPTTRTNTMTMMSSSAPPSDVHNVAADESPTSAKQTASPEKKKIIVKKKIVKPASETTSGVGAIAQDEKTATKKSPVKVLKKPVGKTKTTDLGETISTAVGARSPPIVGSGCVERKFSLPDENLVGKVVATTAAAAAAAERRRSRIFEAAEKFQSPAVQPPDAPPKPLKKLIIPGVSVGNFKKEFERKASLTADRRGSGGAGIDSPSAQPQTPPANTAAGSRRSSGDAQPIGLTHTSSEPTTPTSYVAIVQSSANQTPPPQQQQQPPSLAASAVVEPPAAFTSFSLREARRSMENSIALLQQAKTESNKEVDQLCAQTESVRVSSADSVCDDGGADDDPAATERLKKIRNAREIIGNAIPVGGRSGMGMGEFVWHGMDEHGSPIYY